MLRKIGIRGQVGMTSATFTGNPVFKVLSPCCQDTGQRHDPDQHESMTLGQRDRLPRTGADNGSV